MNRDRSSGRGSNMLIGITRDIIKERRVQPSYNRFKLECSLTTSSSPSRKKRIHSIENKTTSLIKNIVIDLKKSFTDLNVYVMLRRENNFCLNQLPFNKVWYNYNLFFETMSRAFDKSIITIIILYPSNISTVCIKKSKFLQIDYLNERMCSYKRLNF